MSTGHITLNLIPTTDNNQKPTAKPWPKKACCNPVVAWDKTRNKLCIVIQSMKEAIIIGDTMGWATIEQVEANTDFIRFLGDNESFTAAGPFTPETLADIIARQQKVDKARINQPDSDSFSNFLKNILGELDSMKSGAMAHAAEDCKSCPEANCAVRMAPQETGKQEAKPLNGINATDLTNDEIRDKMAAILGVDPATIAGIKIMQLKP